MEERDLADELLAGGLERQEDHDHVGDVLYTSQVPVSIAVLVVIALVIWICVLLG